MIELPTIVGIGMWAVYLLGGIALVTGFLLFKRDIMNKNEFILGFIITGALIITAVLSLCGDAIIEWGYYLTLAVLYAFNCGIRIALGSTNKDGEPTDWKAIGSYCSGGLVSVFMALLVYWA